MDLLVQRFAAQTAKNGSETVAWRVRDDEHTSRAQDAQYTAANAGSIHASSVTFAAIFEWISAVRDTIVTSPADVERPGQRLASLQQVTVIGVALTPCSLEESALVLAVARERRWVYVPLDTSAPLDFQVAVLRDARVEVLVAAPETPIAQFLAANALTLLKGPSQEVSSCPSFRPVVVFRLLSSEPLVSWGYTSLSDDETADDNDTAPLYVLYTSGSSGEPKGVIGTRAGALNRLEWMWQQFPFQAGATSQTECVARVTRLTFVDAVWEILGALLQQVPLVHFESADATVCVQSVVLGQSELFLQAAHMLHVSRFTVVPSVLEVLLRLLQRHQRVLASVRLILVSGEVLPLSLVEQAARALPHATVLNLYGT